MKQCTQGTKFKKVGGRRRQYIGYEDFVEPPPTPTMLRLAAMKNEGYSWRSLAEELQTFSPDATISHSLVRRVTLGHCKSERIDYALGIRTAPPPVPVAPCPDCGKVHTQHKECAEQRQRDKRTKANGWARVAGWVRVENRAAYEAGLKERGFTSLQELIDDLIDVQVG